MSAYNLPGTVFAHARTAGCRLIVGLASLLLCASAFADDPAGVSAPTAAPVAEDTVIVAVLQPPDAAAPGNSDDNTADPEAKKGTAGLLQYRLPENQKRVVLPFLATGALLALTDHSTLSAFDVDPLTEDNEKPDRVFRGLNFMADGRTLGASLVVLYAVGDRSARNTARTSMIALANSAVATTVLKGLVGKERPDESDGAVRYHGPSTTHVSFPSGHTASATAVACVLAHDYPKQRWIWWSLAGAVAVSRISSGQHFASDVFFGAGIGVVSAEGALHNRNELLSWRF